VTGDFRHHVTGRGTEVDVLDIELDLSSSMCRARLSHGLAR